MDFRAFYDQHVTTVWRALLRLGVARTDLPDAVQEVFLVAFRKLPAFEGRSKLSTWLVGICYRVASDRRRLAHVRREIGDSGAVHAARDIGPRPDEQVERSEGARVLDEMLGSLRPEQREVFVMFELEEMSGKEIAALVDAPVKTVFSRLRLAREAVAAALSARQQQEVERAFRATALAAKGKTP
jgi:RNA polymerase sigma-70 factor, ECF subfamily